MTIILDANLAAAVAIPMEGTPRATQLMRSWKVDQERLLAPVLFEYEITTALRRAIALRIMTYSEALEGMDIFLALGIEMVPPSRNLTTQALNLAERIGQFKAYDAHYLALALDENAPFWTADRRLATAAQEAGLNRVHWVGDWRGNDD
ncbi:MAG: type II toxin-antitoxin system VapC family toxin [Chloroflexota bacterium]|jgi:predicted nucleic acid-binding protein